MLSLTLVRHGSTRLNEESRYQGWAEEPLSERGHTQATRLADRLRGIRFDRIVTSDLPRCSETVRIALPDQRVEVDPRLRELHFGEWEGLTHAECHARDAERLASWLADPTGAPTPGGERFDDFCRRVDEGIDTLMAASEVLLVVHSGTIRRAISRVLGLEWAQAARIQLAHCGITRLALDREGGRVLGVNDTAHLEEST